jgi:ER lumen protein retaining receptor
MFNLFRYAGDLLHLASFFILLLKMYSSRSVKGVSFKTQALYVLVFATRYVDLFWNFASYYNWVMKVVFLALSILICYVMKYQSPYCKTYDAQFDDFNVLFLIVPSFVLACFVNEYFSIFEVLWTFSIYLEAVAIIPQLIVVHKHARETGGFVDTLSSHYVFALGGYRALYLLNWIYRLFTEKAYSNWIVWIAGLVQTAIYCDFFWYYLKAQIDGTKMVLPM